MFFNSLLFLQLLNLIIENLQIICNFFVSSEVFIN